MDTVSVDACEGCAPENGDRSDVERSKLKKFTFSKETKYLLLQAVRQHDAHRAPHGSKDEYFTKVLHTVIANLPPRMWETVQKPKMKTMRDKLRAVMAERRETNKRNANSSGIAEEVGPAEQLLDDMLLEVQESEEARRNERDCATAREDALVAAGDQIQRNALTRRQTVGDDGTGSTRSTPRKRRHVEDMDGWNEALERELEHKRASRERELQLRSEELQLSKERWDEEKLEREHNRNQSKKQLDLLISLCEKKQ